MCPDKDKETGMYAFNFNIEEVKGANHCPTRKHRISRGVELSKSQSGAKCITKTPTQEATLLLKIRMVTSRKKTTKTGTKFCTTARKTTSGETMKWNS
jgi:hypothetical protein